MISWGLLAAALVILVYTYILYKDNPLFRFAEATTIGVGSGITLAATIAALKSSAWIPIVTGERVFYVVPVLLGILLLTRLSRKHAYLSSWGMAIIVGVGAAVSLVGTLVAHVHKQLEMTMLPLITDTPLGTFNRIVLFIGTLSILTFFVFTFFPRKEAKGSWKLTYSAISKIGRYILMIAFGTMFGTIVMGRMLLLAAALRIVLEGFGLM